MPKDGYRRTDILSPEEEVCGYGDGWVTNSFNADPMAIEVVVCSLCLMNQAERNMRRRKVTKFIGWVPTQTEYLDTFFELAPVSASDIVYDLGSGDGRLLFKALEKGAGKCIGVDIDPERIRVASETAVSKKVAGRITFIEADVMTVGLSEASVILCYLYPSASAALRPKFEKELKQGTRIVMESFAVPGWKPVAVREKNYRYFYLYTMPPQKTPDYENAISSLSYDFYSDPY